MATGSFCDRLFQRENHNRQAPARRPHRHQQEDATAGDGLTPGPGGLSRKEAIARAGLIRLRPILMTTFAMLAGTLPLALGLGEAAKYRAGMGVAIIGGLIVSTLITLIVVPAVFEYLDRFREFVESKFRPAPDTDDSGGVETAHEIARDLMEGPQHHKKFLECAAPAAEEPATTLPAAPAASPLKPRGRKPRR